MTEAVPCGAHTHEIHRIEMELGGWNDLFSLGLVGGLMAFAVLGLLLGEGRIALAKLVIRDVAVDLALVEVVGIGFVGETGVGGDDGPALVDIGVDAQSSVALLNLLQNGF